MRKFELVNKQVMKNPYGVETEMYQIRSCIDVLWVDDNDDKLLIPKGTLGGFVQHERNLSQFGCAWIHEGSFVFGQSRIEDYSQIISSTIFEDPNIGAPQICGDSTVKFASIYGQTYIFDSYVYDSIICDRAKILKSKITCNCEIYGIAVVDNCEIDLNLAFSTGVINNLKSIDTTLKADHNGHFLPEYRARMNTLS